MAQSLTGKAYVRCNGLVWPWQGSWFSTAHVMGSVLIHKMGIVACDLIVKSMKRSCCRWMMRQHCASTAGACFAGYLKLRAVVRGHAVVDVFQVIAKLPGCVDLACSQ